MGAVDNESYFESLCAQEQYLQTNYSETQSIIKILKSLANEEASDEEIIALLKKLTDKYQSLTASSIDLKYSKYDTREAQIAMMNLGEKGARGSELDSVPDFQEYSLLVENINKELLVYMNLLGRLSSDLAKQIELTDTAVTPVIVDDWCPPEEILSILEKFTTETTKTSELRSKLQHYLDQIKMERARFTLENEYSLKETLDKLNMEVNYWRKEWDNIEMLMFGDGPNSMKRMMKNVNTLRSKMMNTMEVPAIDMH